MTAELLDVIDDAIAFANRRIAKVEADPARAARDRLQEAVMAEMVPALEAYFLGLAVRLGVTADVEEVAKASGLPTWNPRAAPFQAKLDWGDEANRLRKAMNPSINKMLEGGTFKGYEQIVSGMAGAGLRPDNVPYSIGLAGSLSLADYDLSIRDAIGQRIVGINDVTRTKVQSIVTSGIDKGLSPRHIANGTKDFPGIRGYVAQTYKNRARVIALTETANAYNLGQLQGYRDSGLVDKVRIFDGDDCGWTSHDDPDAASGSIRTLEDAEAYPTAHPNCQRSWSPYFEGERQSQATRPKQATATQDIVTTPKNQYSGPLNHARLDSVATERGRVTSAKAAGFDSVDEFNAAVESRLSTMLETAEPRMRVPRDALDSIAKSGRVKSQFETGSSRGMFDPEHRAMVETELWAVADDLAPRSRPIYGYLEGADDVIGGPVSQYGDIVIRLKPDIRYRTTFTGADSLGADMVPSPMVAPRAASVRPGMAQSVARGTTTIDDHIISPKVSRVRHRPIDEAGEAARAKAKAAGLDDDAAEIVARETRREAFAAAAETRPTETAYWEAQYHGGVSLDDFGEVLVPLRGAEVVSDVLPADTLRILTQRGVKVRGYTQDETVNALTGARI